MKMNEDQENVVIISFFLLINLSNQECIQIIVKIITIVKVRLKYRTVENTIQTLKHV